MWGELVWGMNLCVWGGELCSQLGPLYPDIKHLPGFIQQRLCQAVEQDLLSLPLMLTCSPGEPGAAPAQGPGGAYRRPFHL